MAAIESPLKSILSSKPMSASELILSATGIAPEGSMTCDHTQAGQPCSVCGSPLVLGQPIDTLDLPGSFTNHSSLAHPGGKWRCGACTVVMTRSAFQVGASSVLITQEGIYPVVRKEHRAWALQTPPATPFAICVQNSKQQHVVWRSPVNIGPEQILVRVGEQVVRLRQSVMRQASKEAALIASLKKEKGRPSKDGVENPFFIDWKFQSKDEGVLKGFVYKMLEQGVIKQDDIRALLSVNAGEAWALGAYLYANPKAPENIARTIA